MLCHNHQVKKPHWMKLPMLLQKDAFGRLKLGSQLGQLFVCLGVGFKKLILRIAELLGKGFKAIVFKQGSIGR